MASTDVELTTTATESSKTAPEAGYTSARTPVGPPPNYFRLDFLLRLLLLASAVSSLVVLVTSKQTKSFATGLPAPFAFVERDAKFNYSPAFIYLLVALAVTCLYSIITILSSCALMSKPAPAAKILFTLILTDTLMVGILSSATGTAGAIAYVGLKGNSHTNWNKICNNYGKFCRHIGSSTGVSLFASIILVVLVLVSAYSLSKRSYH
ncbi:CASP-like protein [Rhynchospora pubera]|uniref:CASP-like protein n=1 Tax=Rhynchospora pubera TaxID=906938 RepID=A0AAV8FTD0_9POAL|nr:CASP-like protein [Rhynchospora pubera]KAJ4795355.1 CASP-like protein [Rhynchospora pubera]